MSTRWCLVLSVVLLTLSASVALSPAILAGDDDPARLALVGGRLIDGFGGDPLENAVILVDGNPLWDIRVLQHGVVHVIKDGKVYK